ncbi:MAG: helix-turn-helix domain-containing protein [Thermoplasmata archaeon]
MTVEARIRVRHEGCVTRRTHGATSITQYSADGHSSIFLVTAETAEEAEGIQGELQTNLADYTLLSQSANVAMVRGGCPPSGVEESILAYGCSILWPALFMEGEEFYTILAPARERLKQLLERLQEFGGASLLALTEVGPEDLQMSMNLGGIARTLTKRQLETLVAAVNAGYYRSPRQVSTESLAKAFGIGRTTLEEHLRKAESKVLTSVMDVLGNHPVILATARTGGGRFPKAAPSSLHSK